MNQAASYTTTKSIDQLKRDAFQLKKAEGIPHHEALKRVALQEGYPSWELLVKLCAKAN